MDVDTAVIPVAGLGTRMLPVSRLVPKEFLPLGRKSAIHLVADELCNAGIRRLVFVVSPDKASLSKLFGESDNRLDGFEGIDFEFAIQEEQLGLGHAILCAADSVGQSSFAVALGDCLIGLPGQSDLLNQLMKARIDGNGIAIGFERIPRENANRFGIAITDSDDQSFVLHGLVEKPAIENAPSSLAVCGRYVFDASIFKALRQTSFDSTGEIQLTDAINRLIQTSTPAVGVCVDPGVKRYDIGNMESYVAAFTEFAFQDAALRKVILEACASKSETDG